MDNPSTDEQIAQAKFIYDEVVYLAKRFRDRGMRVADLIWVIATICDNFIRASKEPGNSEVTEEQVLNSIAIRLGSMQAAGTTQVLANRLFIDRTIHDLSGGGADFEELKSPFKA